MNHDDCVKTKDWTKVKGIAFSFLVAFLAGFIGYGMWIGKVDTRLFNIEKDVSKHDLQIDAMIASQSNILAELAGIRVEQKNILLGIEELKRR